MKIKFFRKTLSFFIIPVMIPIMILGALSVVTLNRYMCSNMDARYQDRLFSYLTTIDAMMNEVDWLNTSLSTNPSIHTRLKKIIKKCTGGIPAESYVEVNTIVDLLYSSYDANPTVESIYIYFDNTSRYFLSSTNRISNLDFFLTKAGTTATRATETILKNPGVNSESLHLMILRIRQKNFCRSIE